MNKEKELQLKELTKILDAGGLEYFITQDSQDNNCIVFEWDHNVTDLIDDVENKLSFISSGILKDVDYINDIIDYFTTDEVLTCDCGRVAYTQDYHNNHYAIVDDYIVLYEYCLENDEDAQELYFNDLINNYNKVNQFLDIDYIEDKGFKKVDQEFYAGMHDVKITQPIDAAKIYSNKGYDYIFNLESSNMFGIDYSIYIKKQEVIK
jgi:hypothetical protein